MQACFVQTNLEIQTMTRDIPEMKCQHHACVGFIGVSKKGARAL